jgi:hypothetical protein
VRLEDLGDLEQARRIGPDDLLEALEVDRLDI